MVKCECGRIYEEGDFNKWSAWLRCKCGSPVYRRGSSSPLINFNGWKPDYRQMDGEKEFTASGGYE